MTDKITIPAVAYAAMETELAGARFEMEHARRILETKAYWKTYTQASAKVDRLAAQLDRFAPEEQKDARSADAASAEYHTLAGSGGAREPAPINAPGTNGETWANDTARAAENRAGPPSPRATDDTLGELPECLDVTKREKSP